MDENLDPEQIRQVNEQLQTLVSTTENVNDEFDKTTDASATLNKSITDLHKKFEELLQLTKTDLIKNFEKVSKQQAEQAKGLDELTDALDDTATATERTLTKQEKYIQQLTESLGFIKDAHGNYVSAIKQHAQDRANIEAEIIQTIGEENYQRIKHEDKLAEIEKKRQETLKAGGPAILSMTKGANSLESAIGLASSSIMDYAQKQGVSAMGYVTLGVAVQAIELGLTSMKKVLDASIDAQIAYTKSIIGGDRGQAVIAKRNEAIGKAQNDVIRQLGQLSISAGAAGIALTLMAGPIGIVAKVIGVALGGAAIAAGTYAQYTAKAADTSLEFATQLAEISDRLFQGMNDLAAASLIGSDGITGLAKTLEKLRMGDAEIGKFTAIVKSASKELAMLGPGSVQGLNNFTNVAADLIDSKLGDQLRYMGINNEKQAEHVLKFMTQQARLGMAAEKDQKKQAEAAGKYVIELDKLAVLTGATREEQEKARDMVMANEELRAKLLTANTEEEKARIQKQIDFATELMASGQKEMAAGAARYFASGGKIVDEFSQKFTLSMGKTGKKVLAGEGTTEENLVDATTEAMVSVKKFAAVTAISADSTKELIPSVVQTANAAISMEKAAKAAAEAGLSLPDYLKKERESRDKRTKDQADTIENQRKEAILRQKDAVDKFGSATGLFKQGVDAFVGKTGPGPKTSSGSKPNASTVVEQKSEIAKTAKADADKKAEAVAALNDQIKASKEQERQMVLAGASEEERRKQKEKTAKIEGDLQKAIEEEKTAANTAAQAALAAANARREQTRAANKLPDIEAKLIKETETLDRVRAELSKNEKELEEASKDPKKKYNAMIMQDLSYMVKQGRSQVADLEKNIAGTRGQLKETRQQAGVPSASIPSSQQDLAQMGLKIKKGDVQREGAEVDPKLLEMAKQVQEQVPNFQHFSSFNDNYHKDSSSQHAKGKAFDFTLSKAPSKEEGQQIVSMLKDMGASLAIDEYHSPSAKATAGHIHAEMQARDGGLFVGPDSGYQVTLHGKEKVIPMDKPNPDVEKTELKDIPPAPNNNQTNNIDRVLSLQTDLMNMIANKLDALDSRLAKSNDIQSDILTYSAA